MITVKAAVDKPPFRYGKCEGGFRPLFKISLILNLKRKTEMESLYSKKRQIFIGQMVKFSCNSSPWNTRIAVTL